MEQVKHNDQDLYEFKVLIEKKKEQAEHELSYLLDCRDKGKIDYFPEDKLKMIIDRQHDFIASLDAKLVKIANKTFGVTSAGKLVPKEKVIELITASKAHEEEINFQSDAAVSALVQKLQQPAEPKAERKCRVCGCTQNDCRQCIEKTGSHCSWVETDLCSACVEPASNQKQTASTEVIQLPDNIHEMEFFKQLHAAANGVDISITLKEKNGKFTISALPNIGDTGRIKPLLATGTPEELDADFHNLITRPLHQATGIISNAEEFKKGVEEVVEEDKEDAKPKANTSSSKSAPKKSSPKASPKKTAASKPVASKPSVKKEVKPAAPELPLQPAKPAAEETATN